MLLNEFERQPALAKADKAGAENQNGGPTGVRTGHAERDQVPGGETGRAIIALDGASASSEATQHHVGPARSG